MLNRAGYPSAKTQFLVNSFTHGFSLGYEGPRNIKKTAPNLKLRVGSKIELWNKMMIEVKEKRFAGPFDEPPFEHFIQSLIGLVPKDKGTKTRLIFHLSYPRDGDSVNSQIPLHLCKVKYPDFTQAIEMCIKAGKNCKIAKSDMARAFRNVPLSVKSFNLLVMKCENPRTGKVQFFFDKCLPFGSSISCAIFQAISDSISFLVQFKTGIPNLNYLDDYFFVALYKKRCDDQVRQFLSICDTIGFPVAAEKTHWGANFLVFLGLVIDTLNQVIRIPKEKVEKVLKLTDNFLTKKRVTVLQVQKLCRTLNFLCKGIVPGRVFLMRLYAMGCKQ